MNKSTARNNLKLAESTLARLLPLESKGYVTNQQVDTARTAKRDAQTSLEQALRQADAASALVTTLDATQALVEARQAALAIAERALAQTQVYAPHDGLVVGLHVSSGEIIAPGQALFTLIDTQHWYAVATFPETELSHIAIGDCARVYVLSDRAKPIKGKVESIGWGVVSEDMINLPRGLPYVPKSLNWVRIEQRFPVQIELTNPPPNLMRMGASAVTIVHQGARCGNE
jgi:multidrug efflux system membrane fusion protein